MAAKAKARKADALRDEAADYFAARSHEAWRRALLKTNPEQKGKPRMRLRGGIMVDVNQPWRKLHPKAKADNRRAAYDAYDAVVKFPNDREAAAAYVHACWMRRNKQDPSQPKALFKPYARLPEVEKDKDRAHVDNMRKALAALRRRAPRKAPRKKQLAPARTIEIDAKTWRRLEAAARDVSRLVGRKVAAEALASAGVELMASVGAGLAAEARSKKT
jgi:hypothetical protein